jgi:preprotein translocase subunit SecY
MKQNVINPLPVINLVVFMFTLTGGSMLLTWLGDLLTEKGIDYLLFSNVGFYEVN